MEAAAAQLAFHRAIARLAGSRPESAHPTPELRPAAVLVGLVSPEAEPGILLTVRAAGLRLHAGQIAFPGGRIEPQDASPAVAALREAREEVGLASQDAEIIGFLPDQQVRTGYHITPVVARIAGDFRPVIDPAEVQACFVLPWSVLLDASGRGQGEQPIQFGRHHIWGATARILQNLRKLVDD